MSKKKIIIRNCPAIYKKLRINENNAVYIDEYRCNYQTLNPCQDCTDCKMKQIVEKCKKYIENYNDKVFYDNDDVKILMGKVMLSQSILSELLDIEEVE